MTEDQSTLPDVVAALRSLSGEPDARALAEVDLRDIHYPVGSGQGDELALRWGLRPLIRELLTADESVSARARLTQAGFVCVEAPLAYGPTHDGWDYTPDPSLVDASQMRRALFVGRDRARIDDAIAHDVAKTDDGDRELGRLLGYPRCCVDAFVTASSQRKNIDVATRALAATEAAPMPRLNVLDLGVFHYLSWYPCSFRCAWSAAYADALAARLSRRMAGFVRDIDRALARHRLVLHDDVQLSIDGTLCDDGLHIDNVRPTSRDRHPRATVSDEARPAVACALSLVRSARRVSVDDGKLLIDGVHAPLPCDVLLAPFGPRAS